MNTTPLTSTTLAEELESLLGTEGLLDRNAVALAGLAEDYEHETIVAFVDNFGLRLDSAEDWADDFRDAFIGSMSVEEYAEDIFFDLYDVPEELRFYINTDRFANDLTACGDVVELNGYLFRGNW